MAKWAHNHEGVIVCGGGGLMRAKRYTADERRRGREREREREFGGEKGNEGTVFF